jgi:hypothetical protein
MGHFVRPNPRVITEGESKMNESRLNGGVQTGLAGAMALAAGSGAYASIVVVTPPANIPNLVAPTATPNIPWDVNGDAVNDFTFGFRNPQASPGNGVQWQANSGPVTAAGVNAIIGYTGPFLNYATKLAAGASISGAATFKNTAQVCLGSFYRSSGVVTAYGQFATGTVPANSIVRGFIGFKFDIGGSTRFGWLDVEVRGSSSAANSGGIFFFGAAYENSGQAIQAGVVPAPGALAALAIGAAAVGLRRKRDEAAA